LSSLSGVRRRFLPVHQLCERKLHRLSFLFFELTHACNLQCVHCGSDCTREDRGPRLKQDDVLRVLGEVRRAYDPHKITVVLSGGEPLCYPGVFELGRAIHALEFPWGMVTNGFAWTAKEVALARRGGMATVTVSLDGEEEEHDWFRGRRGSFARAVATIRMLTAEPFFQAMDVVTCVHRRNLAGLPALRALLRDLGVGSWRLFTVSPIGRASGNPELPLSPEEFRSLFQRVAEFRREEAAMRDAARAIRVSYSESGYFGGAIECGIRDESYFCRAGIRVGGVMVNGDILACPNIDRSFRQGNIHADSFVDVWEHRYQVFRDRAWMKTGVCASCGQWRYCQGNSFHLWDPEAEATRICYWRTLGGA
jgi:radical SAM protein with 4Fe4S-binding SPASM domain